MISSSDYALLVTFKKELEDLKALYTHPPKEIIVVKEYMEKRIKEIEKQNES